MFIKIDVNGDRKVDAAEFTASLETNDNFTRFAKRRGKSITFDEIDANGSGKISWKEFRAFMLKAMDEVYPVAAARPARAENKPAAAVRPLSAAMQRPQSGMTGNSRPLHTFAPAARPASACNPHLRRFVHRR